MVVMVKEKRFTNVYQTDCLLKKDPIFVFDANGRRSHKNGKFKTCHFVHKTTEVL